MHRRTAVRVKRGKVQKKNRLDLTPHYSQTAVSGLTIDRKRPGKGYRHLLLQRDITDFVSLLPDWDELAKGLDAIVLTPGAEDHEGSHYYGVIEINAWPDTVWTEHGRKYVDEHVGIISKLEIPREKQGSWVLLKWTEQTAKAFQLLHVFLHELGHHHDAITNRSKLSARGETYAEEYALRYGDLIWERYWDRFS
jgi:hypothetical protein